MKVKLKSIRMIIGELHPPAGRVGLADKKH